MTSHVACDALGASRVYHLKCGRWWSASLLFSLLLSHRLEASCFAVCKCRARLADRVMLVRRPENPYDNNCLDLRVVRSSLLFLLGHLAAEVVVHLSLLLCDAFKGSHVPEVSRFMTSCSQQ